MHEQLFHVGVKALIRNSAGQVLLLRMNQERIKGDEKFEWDLPGGRVKAGDDAGKTLLREVEEETGFRKLRGVKFFDAFLVDAHIPADNLTVSLALFVFTAATDEQKIKLSHEHAGYKWVTAIQAADMLNNLPESFNDKVRAL